MDRMGFPTFRVLTDYAGPAYYTLILEGEFETLNSYETSLARELQDPLGAPGKPDLARWPSQDTAKFCVE